MFLIGLLPGKVVIGAESRLKLNYAKDKTNELEAKDNNMVDVKEATKN